MTNKPAKDEVAARLRVVDEAAATILDLQRELATVRAERDAAIANNTELQGKLASDRTRQADEMIRNEKLQILVDGWENEWAIYDDCDSTYRIAAKARQACVAELRSALAGQGEERDGKV
jgi:hypothetical protein